MQEEDAYILGTERAELHRLGLQHQIWASEAQRGWELAGFSRGQTLLDLGSGPGFCSKEMAYIVGEEGQVIAVDRSEQFIHFVQQINKQYGLNIDARAVEFDDLQLEENSLDGMYCRWAMAWVPNPKEILAKVAKALKPGGKMVLHEYYDWSTHQTSPQMPHLSEAIAACLKSFKEQPGDIDVGRELPRMLTELGMEISHTRPMIKMARPHELTWQWPRSFYDIYFPKLVQMGYLSEETKVSALKEVALLEKDPSSTLCCPMLIEVIAVKA